MFPVLAVAALRWEGACLANGLSVENIDANRTFRLTRLKAEPGPVWVLVTGMGAEATGAGLEWASGIASPRSVVSAGVGGGLVSGLRSGELIVAEEVVDEQGDAVQTALAWVERYENAAQRASLSHRLGRILTASSLLADESRKASAGLRHAALAVDMEGITVGRWAARRGLPFAAARVVLDTLERPISPAVQRMVGADGRPRPLAVARELARHPALIAELLSLGRATAAARRALAAVHRQLFGVGE